MRFRKHNYIVAKSMSKLDQNKQTNSQDVFLNAIRKEKVRVTMFLVNGIKLQGAIISFDNFCVLLKKDTTIQLVYKHAISTILPNEAIDLRE